MPTTLTSKFLEDSQGNKFAPITTPNAVRWPNGDNLADKLSVVEDEMSIVTQASGTTLSAALNTYYRFTYNVGTLAVTLPAVSDATKVQTVVLYLTTGSSPSVSVTAPSGVNVYYQDTYEISASSTYEINCLYNGGAWVVTAAKFTIA